MMMAMIILVIGVLGTLTKEFGSMRWLIENENRMRTFVDDYPWQGWLLGFGLYTAFSLVPGTAGKSVVWGWLFGFWPAVLIIDGGLTIAAILSFLAARFAFRDIVTARYAGLVTKLDRSLEHDGGFYLLMMRLAHVPFTFINYGAAATSIPLTTFAWTTALGVLPGTMIFVFVGTRIPTLSALAHQGVWQMVDPLLIGLLAATFLFPIVVRWALHKYRTHTGGPPVLDLTEIDPLAESPRG